jgi:hypothetical protein
MSSDDEDQAIPEVHRPIGPLCGGYYWFPTPGPEGVRWSLLTCEDLGFASDQGHPDLWPAVIDRLAVTWGKNATALRRHLKDYYSALPRGRVTRPDRYLILHGDDASVADWLTVVIRSFRLQRVRYRVVFDEHERRLPDDCRRLQGALGILIPAPTCRDSTPKR